MVGDDFDFIVLCGGPAPGEVRIACIEKHTGVSVDASVTKKESFEATDVVENVAEKAEFEILKTESV